VVVGAVCEPIADEWGIASVQLGFGTWQSAPGEVGQSVEVAIEKGYRHLDFAKVYQNQKEIAPALKKSGVPRSELFLT